jgi:peptidoglycan/xylan/chitin deacetylase (PgdA/CDA1 family)
MKIKKHLTLLIGLVLYINCAGQAIWKGKTCAVALTYDDALDVHLDHAIPVLDSLKLKATFYLIGSSSVVVNRMNEWRNIAKKGHELGNHSLFHPCDRSLPGRRFVTADNDLSKYTLARTIKEIRACNTLLKAIDGEDARTFAYPCGDMKIGDSLFYPLLAKDFVGARGVNFGLPEIDKIKLDNINSFVIINQTAAEMIEAVKKAASSHSLLVFLFHGVGGGHSLDVNLKEHNKLLYYLKQNEKQIWIAPLFEVATYISHHQQQKK